MELGFYNMDCMEGMKEFPDKYFDLAIVDPPYGGGTKEKEGNIEAERCGGTWAKKYGKNIQRWDKAPKKEYFDELFRVSKNQIIWGGNYFGLPPTRCLLVWRKSTISESFSMAMAEYAWTSFNSNAKVFECAPMGTFYDERFHPTQKPIKLYMWCLDKFAKYGDKILDTHVGSGSSLIACTWLGLEYCGFEIDSEYYQNAKERIEKMTNQTTIDQML